MTRPRSTVLLTLAALLVSPGEPGPATAGAPRISPVGTITGLTEPAIRQVVQRRDDNVGDVLVVGTYAGGVDGFQARSTLRPGMSGHALDWTPLVDVTTAGGNFVGVFRQPAGGFYDIQVRPTYRGQVGQAATVVAVGVGEVFITAGQSNATNSGNPTGFVPDLRVSSFDPGSGFGLDPSFPGSSWRWGIDPQPVIDGSVGGSVWPTMANNLAVVHNVPIGLYSVGCTTTSIADWLPGKTIPTLVSAQTCLFGRLTNAINYFNARGGVRAVLWDQGETDTFLHTPPAIYEADLRLVINESRAITGVPVKWMVARATGPPTNRAIQVPLERAQANVCDGLMTFSGPNTDALGLQYRQSPPGLTVHFNAAGVELLGTYWGIYVFNTPQILGPGFLPPP